jgi:hypothetical protein
MCASRFLFFLLFFFGVINSSCSAATGFAISSGNYNDPATWLIDGIARVPTCGDTIIIPSGYTVTVSTQAIYTCTVPMLIVVNGYMQFVTGNKLTLPCGSIVQINSGGALLPGNGGGNSNYVNICNMVWWNASGGMLNGPATLGYPLSLPVEFLSFYGEAMINRNDLFWSTATEINNDFFIIERATQDMMWTEIGLVNGSGNSSVICEYTFSDLYPQDGWNYYRLKQTDFDGRFKFSNVISLLHNGKENKNLSATLHGITAVVQYTSSRKSEADLSIYSLGGALIFSERTQLEKGINQLEFSVPLLVPGLYLITVNQEGISESLKTFAY